MPMPDCNTITIPSENGGTITCNQLSVNFEVVRDICQTAVMIYGAYDSDADAGADSVPVDGLYELTAANIYGMPEGTLKRRKS